MAGLLDLVGMKKGLKFVGCPVEDAGVGRLEDAGGKRGPGRLGILRQQGWLQA